MNNKTTIFYIIFCACILISALAYRACSPIEIPVKQIANFSDIKKPYVNEPDNPLFHHIRYLPYQVTLPRPGTSDHNSILYLNESVNMVPIADSLLHLFLAPTELESAFDTYINSTASNDTVRRSINYYAFNRIVEENYVLLTISRQNHAAGGRDYTYMLRTYTHSGDIISNLDLAKWDEINDIFHAGMIRKDRHIELQHSEHSIRKANLKKIYRITEQGVFTLVK